MNNEQQSLKSTRDGFGMGMIEVAKKNPNIVALCADLTESLRLNDFAEQFPGRFIQVGIAEQNMIGVASGMAIQGKIPFAASFAVFSPGRTWEQIRDSVCYSDLPVIIVGGHTGLNVGEDGYTQQGLEDLALMRVLPNMTIVSPVDFEETRKEDFFIYQPAEYELEFSYRSDTRKKLVYGSGIEHSYGVNEQFNEDSSKTEIEFYSGYRLSNQFKVELGISNGISKNEIGYVFDENDNLYFGNRKVKFTENNISLNYNFNSYKSLNLKFRQFWSSALYKDDFFLLKSDGNRVVSDKNISDYDPNTNFNLWNLDLSYDWEFAPGSKITFLYRNNIFNEDNLSGISYYNSTKELFEKPINHQLSLRINYFIDFNLLKKKKV